MLYLFCFLCLLAVFFLFVHLLGLYCRFNGPAYKTKKKQNLLVSSMANYEQVKSIYNWKSYNMFCYPDLESLIILISRYWLSFLLNLLSTPGQTNYGYLKLILPRVSLLFKVKMYIRVSTRTFLISFVESLYQPPCHHIVQPLCDFSFSCFCHRNYSKKHKHAI